MSEEATHQSNNSSGMLCGAAMDVDEKRDSTMPLAPDRKFVTRMFHLTLLFLASKV